MARLVAQDDFPLPVIEELRQLGHDIVTVPADGMSRGALKAHARISRQLVVVDGAAGAVVETPRKPRRRRRAAGITQE